MVCRQPENAKKKRQDGFPRKLVGRKGHGPRTAAFHYSSELVPFQSRTWELLTSESEVTTGTRYNGTQPRFPPNFAGIHFIPFSNIAKRDLTSCCDTTKTIRCCRAVAFVASSTPTVFLRELSHCIFKFHVVVVWEEAALRLIETEQRD